MFVADYVQFQFNGPRLTAFVWPHVNALEGEKRLGVPGYRDALVSLIFRKVTDVTMTGWRGTRSSTRTSAARTETATPLPESMLAS